MTPEKLAREWLKMWWATATAVTLSAKFVVPALTLRMTYWWL